MRLCKKAAAALLAAVMAVSMLTACSGASVGGGGSAGGGSTGGGNNPGGGSSTVEPAPEPDDVILPGSGDDGQEGAKKTPIEKSKSKLYAFNEKAKNAAEIYAEETIGVYNADGKAVSSEKITVAYADSGVYEKISEEGVELEQVFQKNGEKYDEYVLSSADKAAVKIAEVPGDEMEKVKVGYKLPDTGIYSTTVKVHSIDYYAETYTNDGVEYTVCFENDMPKYEFDQYPSQGTQYIVYNAFQFGTGSSRGLCKLPAGTKVYTEGSESNKLKDENGNEYQVTMNKGNDGNITSVTVTDKNNNDVTNQFKWVLKFAQIGIIS